MPQRFFVDSGDVEGARVVLSGPAAHHVSRSLRMRAGETIVVVDGDGLERGVVLRRLDADRVEGDVTWTRPVTGEPALRITVVQALPRERMEDCIDLLVEVGAAEVRPVITERVVSRPAPDRTSGRARRWQAVAAEAAQLAGRGVIPRVHEATALRDALSALDGSGRLIACAFDGGPSLADIDVDTGRPLALCIGPEGGFGERDLEVLRSAGAEMVHLGARILRTRYAGAIACALLLAHAGDLRDRVAPEPVQ